MKPDAPVMSTESWLDMREFPEIYCLVPSFLCGYAAPRSSAFVLTAFWYSSFSKFLYWKLKCWITANSGDSRPTSWFLHSRARKTKLLSARLSVMANRSMCAFSAHGRGSDGRNYGFAAPLHRFRAVWKDRACELRRHPACATDWVRLRPDANCRSVRADRPGLSPAHLSSGNVHRIRVGSAARHSAQTAVRRRAQARRKSRYPVRAKLS